MAPACAGAHQEVESLQVNFRDVRTEKKHDSLRLLCRFRRASQESASVTDVECTDLREYL
jgi:hypothetical protein